MDKNGQLFILVMHAYYFTTNFIFVLAIQNSGKLGSQIRYKSFPLVLIQISLVQELSIDRAHSFTVIFCVPTFMYV